MAAPSLLKKEIVQIPLKDEIPERQICLVYDSQHPMGAAAREIKKYNSVDYIKEAKELGLLNAAPIQTQVN